VICIYKLIYLVCSVRHRSPGANCKISKLHSDIHSSFIHSLLQCIGDVFGETTLINVMLRNV